MIQNWKKFYRMHSVQLAVALGVLAGLEPYVPMLASVLPAAWVPIAALLIVVARLVRQGKLEETTPTEVWDEAMKARDGGL